MSVNRNTLYNKFSRYVAGGTTEQANDRIEWWERFIFDTDYTDIVYAVEDFYTGRLDLISNTFYGEPRYWWVIAQYNNILDPLSEVKAGRILYIPQKERLSLMLSSKKGGIESQRQPINTISPIVG